MTDFYPFLIAPVLLMLFENERITFFLYLIVCVTLAGWDGLATGLLFWFLAGLVRLGLHLLDARGLLKVKNEPI